MAKVTATRRLQWCSGHRVMGHENKCANLHGHNYVGYFTAEANDLDNIGRVVDFSVLKEKIGNWIDRQWDHTTLVYVKDHMMLQATSIVDGNKPTFVAEWNPTAENMAQYLIETVCPIVLKGTGVRVTHIKLYETENCFAEVSID